MANERLHESINEPWQPAPTRASQLLREWGVLALLSIGLLFVQLPLMWMILTAFKAPNTAFKLDFWPNTSIYTPERDLDPYFATPIESGRHYAHFEFLAPGVQTVQVRLLPATGDEQAAEMRRGPNGVWFATLDIPPGEYRYGFSTGDPELATDPANPPADGGEYSSFSLGEPGSVWTAAPGFGFKAWQRGGQIEVEFTGEPGRELYMETSAGESALTDAEGRYTASGTADASSFRLVEKRPFGEALREMYTVENFAYILGDSNFNFGRFFLNSLVVATLAGLLTVIICTLAGYAFAQKHFHFREPLFALLLTSMLIPGMIFMVPQFSITLQLGWLDTFQGLIIPHLANVFGLFLLRQYIAQIPGDLFAAAQIDGATEARIFQTIVIPLCLPIMVTLFLLVFVGQWSNFLWQLIITTGGESPVITLPVGLQQFKGQFGSDWERIMAGACFSIIPIALLFLSLQKYFLEGLTAGAVKE